MVLFSFFVFPDSPPFLRLFRNDTRCIKPGVDTAGHSFFKMLGASAGDEHCVAAQWGFGVFSENFLGTPPSFIVYRQHTPKFRGFLSLLSSSPIIFSLKWVFVVFQTVTQSHINHILVINGREFHHK